MLDHLHKMSNVELNNLAKNRFLPEATQIWIANNGNYSARMYLGENKNLCYEARNTLWAGKSFKIKLAVVGSNHFKDELDEVEQLYFDNVNHRCMKHPYHRFAAFVSNYRCSNVNTTPKILNHIYDWLLAGFKSKDHRHYSYKHYALAMGKCDVFDITLAIKMSQSECDPVRQLGFQKLVELRSQNH